MVSLAKGDGKQILTLAGEVTIRDAEEVAARLKSELVVGDAIEVHTADLERIDTCMLQLLCSLRKTVTAFEFRAPSDVFMQAVNRRAMGRDLTGVPEGE